MAGEKNVAKKGWTAKNFLVDEQHHGFEFDEVLSMFVNHIVKLGLMYELL